MHKSIVLDSVKIGFGFSLGVVAAIGALLCGGAYLTGVVDTIKEKIKEEEKKDGTEEA